MKKITIVSIALTLALGIGTVSGCFLTPDGEQGIELVENMSEQEFLRWKREVVLLVAITADRLVAEEVVSQEDLTVLASVLASFMDGSLAAGTGGFLGDALGEQGLTNSEVELITLYLEDLLRAHGLLGELDPDSGLWKLSPRTKSLLNDLLITLR